VDSNLLSDAINLTLFGMGFVFVFLTLMVVLTSLMSAFVWRLQPFVSSASVSPIQTNNLIDEDTKSIIEKAIRLHTGA
jgi:oxaloacetate decarboxylase gamma subunit